MKALRFICFASLLAIILLAGSADPGGTAADIEASKPPTAVDLRDNAALENLREPEPSGNRSSGAIMITMTTAAEGPGVLPGK